MSEGIRCDHKHSTSKMIQWSQIIFECKNSGLKVDDWCMENGINPKSYWRWHHILKEQYMEYCKSSKPAVPEFYEVEPQPAQLLGNNVLATLHIGAVSADIYSADAKLIDIICKSLKSC